MAGIDRPVAIVLSLDDDVGTVLAQTPAGTTIVFRDGASGDLRDETVVTGQTIPFGHKVARKDKSLGQRLIKYGQPIGVATEHISAGDHVHSHNLRSLLTPAPPVETEPPVVKSAAWLRGMIASCLQAAEVPEAIRNTMADALTEAHLRGIETHGLRRLKPYIERIALGGVDGAAAPRLVRRGAVLLVDGCNGIGHHVAAVAADAVSAVAREHGVGVALIRNSNHFGFAGYYATRIAAKGQVSLVTSNGQVCVAPTGAQRALFSNDPVAIAAPVGPDTYVELDMATSVTSRAKIAQAMEESGRISRGLATDEDGHPTEDAAAALKGSLLPFGGDKGFALLFAIEVLTGVLTGGAYADLVSSKEGAPDAPEGVAHFLMAIDLELTLGSDRFGRRLQDLIHRLETLPMKATAEPPRYPGRRRGELRRQRLRDGVPLSRADFDRLAALAVELGVWAE